MPEMPGRVEHVYDYRAMRKLAKRHRWPWWRAWYWGCGRFWRWYGELIDELRRVSK